MEVSDMSIRRKIRAVVVAGAIGLAGTAPAYSGDRDGKVRPQRFAGSWYPGDAGALTEMIDDLLARAPAPVTSGKPLAVIAPHAGYRFSAAVASAGYRYLQDHEYKRVIVLAFDHRRSSQYQGVDVPRDLTAYRTPLGEVPLDRDVCDQLLENRMFNAHKGVGDEEHSLELQLPFLQRVLKDFRLVPLLVGRMSTEDYARAAEAILPWIDEDTLLVASSDFTHFGRRFGYEPFKDDVPNKLRELGDQAAEPILNCDFDGFTEYLAETRDTICGRGPIALLLRVFSMT